MDAIRQMMERSSNLPPKQQVVAKYLLDNWENASFESATTMAKKLNMSQSSVIRTINALGFKGVPQFQAALSKYIRQRLSTVDRMDLASQNVDSVENLIRKNLKMSEKNLTSSCLALPVASIDQAVSFIRDAKNIYVLGMRSSASMAHFLGFNLNLILHNTTIIYNDYGIYEKIQGIGEDDVVIVFTFSRYTKLSIDASRVAKKNGCKLISITDSFSSPIANISDLLFVLNVESFHITNSYVAVSAFCDILFSALLLTEQKKYRNKVKEIEEGFQNMNIFDSMESDTPSLTTKL